MAFVALFFLILPIALMVWMLVAQRSVRRRLRDKPQSPPVQAWEEVVKSADGLVYTKKFNPNEELETAAGRVDDAKRIEILGAGL